MSGRARLSDTREEAEGRREERGVVSIVSSSIVVDGDSGGGGGLGDGDGDVIGSAFVVF